MAAVDWAKFFLTVIGGTGAALLIAAFLGKTLIKQMLDREQKRFQADLDTQRVQFEAKLRQQTALEIEQVRGVIDLGRIRHEVMLARLQDQRLRVIGRLYEKLVKARVETYNYVIDSTTEARSERVDKLAENAYAALHDALAYFSRVQVWLPKKTAADIEAFTKEVFHLQIVRKTFSPARRGASNFELVQEDELRKAWEAVTTTLPEKLEALTDALRALLDPNLPV